MNRKIRHDAGQEIELGWDPRRCIHTAECIHSLPDVFVSEPNLFIDGVEKASNPGQAQHHSIPTSPLKRGPGHADASHGLLR